MSNCGNIREMMKPVLIGEYAGAGSEIAVEAEDAEETTIKIGDMAGELVDG